MRPWVDIEGSGIDITILRGSVDGSGLNAGTVHGASNAELRELTVEALSTPSAISVIALYNPATSPRVYRVKLVAQGILLAWGMRNATSAPRIEECEIRATANGGTSSSAYGIVYSSSSGLPAGRSSVLRSKITATGAGNNYGIYMIEGQVLTELRDSRIDALGGSKTYGLCATGPGWQGADVLTLRDTEVNSGGASVHSYGILFEPSVTISLTVYDSLVFGHVSPQAYGISHLGQPAVGVQGSSLAGATKVAETNGNMLITSTAMVGGPTSAAGWLGCVGVWDELAVFYPGNACPP